MTGMIKTNGAPTGNPYIDSLINGGQWVQEPGKPAVISYSFQWGDDPMDQVPGIAEKWTDAEKAAMRSAQASWEAVANIKYVEAANERLADVWYWKNPALGASGAAGNHEFPAFSTGPLYAMFDSSSPAKWNDASLAPGGLMGMVLRHELGHGLGLAHPHDGGEAADGSLFPGVTDENPAGDNGMNSGIYTVMSYNMDNHGFPDHGYLLTPMAFDIAAIQQMYGANMTTATGDDAYVLPSADGLGIGWSCIWDAGGTDVITAGGTTDNTMIDLRQAPLVGEHAGGYISRAGETLGGFTIANGAVIENAIGGNGADEITGNEAANVLTGNGGDDRLIAGAGDDTLNGGDGDDWLDTEDGSDTANGGAGDDEIGGRTGNDTLNGGNGKDWLSGDEGNDVLIGGGGNDEMLGRDGNDTLTGGFGNDTLTGGAGNDRFVISEAPLRFNIDTVADFSAVDDILAIDNLFLTKLKDGELKANAFWIGTQAHDGNDRIVFDSTSGKLWYDDDGKGRHAAQLICTLDTTGLTGTLTVQDFIVI